MVDNNSHNGDGLSTIVANQQSVVQECCASCFCGVFIQLHCVCASESPLVEQQHAPHLPKQQQLCVGGTGVGQRGVGKENAHCLLHWCLALRITTASSVW